MRGRTGPIRGFTFLELLVVVSILAILTAAIIPVYGASLSAMQRRSLRGDMVAAIYFLQELSIHQSRELRLLIDTRKGAWYAAGWTAGMGEEATFEPLDERSLGSPQSIPDSLAVSQVKARRDRESGLDYIAFYPNGACDPAEIRFGPRRGGDATFTIETTGALGEVRVTP